MTLNVYFIDHQNNWDGSAVLRENLITDECILEIDSGVFIDETRKFIDKATQILKKRYENVTVKMHWDIIGKDDKNE